MSSDAGFLDSIRVATPCRVPWERMAGNDQVRYCTQCRLNVFNIAGMTRAKAESVIAEADGRVCIRLYRRFDGTVLTADCPVGLRASVRRIWAMGAAAAAVC